MFGCGSEALATHKMNDDTLPEDETHVFDFTEGIDFIEDIRQRQCAPWWFASMERLAKKSRHSFCNILAACMA